MNTLGAALTTAAILAFAVPAAYRQIRCAAFYESEQARIVRETHERAEAARLLDPVTLAQSERDYEDYAAGRALLLDALRDEQNKGEL